jgi:hypothetical protein
MIPFRLIATMAFRRKPFSLRSVRLAEGREDQQPRRHADARVGDIEGREMARLVNQLVEGRLEVEEVDDVTTAREDAVGEITKDATDEKGGGGFGDFVRKGALLPEKGDASEGDEADRAEDPVGMLVAVQQAEGHARVVDADEVEETGDHFDEILGRSIVREPLQDEPLRPLVEGEERCGEEEKVSDHAG